MSQRFRILTVDDNEEIHDDFRKLLTEDTLDDEMSELQRLLDAPDENDALGGMGQLATQKRRPKSEYALDRALQGQDAYEMVKAAIASNDPYSLAFVDIRMPPGWDGVETILRIWSADPNIHVVICSAYSDYSWKDLVERLGATDQMLFLRKPFDGVAVKQMAMAMTEKWRLSRLANNQIESLEFSVADRTYELRQTLEDLEQRNLELVRQSEAKSEFLARMSYAIRTPLSGVLGMAQRMTDTSLDLRQKHYLGTIFHCGHALRQVVDDVLDFSRIESGRLELESVELELRDLIDGVLDVISSGVDVEKIRLSACVHPDVPDAIVGDPTRLRQVLLKLLSNACQYTSVGQVVLRLETVEGLDGRPHVRFTVSDSGNGISDDQLQHLFDPFSIVDENDNVAHSGSGLGLAIAFRTVRLMGSHLSVKSELGKGTRFVFGLPMGTAQLRIRRESDVRRALIVTADAAVEESLRLYLDGMSIRSQHLKTIEDARDLAGVDPEYDFVFVDESLEDLSDIWVKKDGVSGIGVQTRCVLLLRSDAPPCVPDALSESFGAALRRPIRYGELVSILETGTWTGAERWLPQADTRQFDGRILVVDDNGVNLEVTAAMLRELGCTVTTAAGGTEALQVLASHRFDLILMDLHMPGLDGVGTTRLIRAREQKSGQHTPIVALTADVMDSGRKDFRSWGMDDRLAKPAEREDIANILEKYLSSQELREVS